MNARLAYGHALLLALANPYKYTQRELIEVIAFTRTVAPYVELRPGVVDRSIAMNTDSDRGPGYLPDWDRQVQFDLSRSTRDLGYVPAWELEKGLQTQIEWIRSTEQF